MSLNSAASKFILYDLVQEIIFFPFWWYTLGAWWVAQILWKNFLATERRLAIRLLLINIFQPMYGQTDRVGRIISFFVRFFIVLVRGSYWLAKGILLLGLLLTWFIAPIVLIARLFSFIF